MALHQVVNSIGVKIYNGYWYNNLDWQTHLHKSFEFVFVKKGVLNAVIGNREYKINKGQCALVMPYEAHSYEGNAQYFVAIFSADFCESFSKEINGLIPQRHVFNMDEDALKFLKKYLMAENTDSSNAYRVTDPPYYFIKASIYTICASFYEKVNFIRGVKNNLSITAIIDYIENNFNENITLASLANKLGYDYHYISRLFNETFKINFKTFINQYRCEKAAYLLLSTDRSVSDIALACGFQSVRNFNRVFFEYASLTPTNYRTNKKIT